MDLSRILPLLSILPVTVYRLFFLIQPFLTRDPVARREK